MRLIADSSHIYMGFTNFFEVIVLASKRMQQIASTRYQVAESKGNHKTCGLWLSIAPSLPYLPSINKHDTVACGSVRAYQ